MESFAAILPKQTEQHQQMIDVINPFTQGVVSSIPAATLTDVEAALISAKHGFEISRKLARYHRANILAATAVIVRQELEAFALLIVSEAGKTIVQARKEVCTSPEAFVHATKVAWTRSSTSPSILFRKNRYNSGK